MKSSFFINHQALFNTCAMLNSKLKMYRDRLIITSKVHRENCKPVKFSYIETRYLYFPDEIFAKQGDSKLAFIPLGVLSGRVLGAQKELLKIGIIAKKSQIK